MKPIPAFLLCVSLLFAASAHADQPSWHTSLSFGDGGIWKHRIPVDFENRGSAELAGVPVAVCLPEIGITDGKRSRVVRADGQEVMFGEGSRIGPKDENRNQFLQTVLYIPVDAKPGETTRYYVYTDGHFSSRRDLPEKEMLSTPKNKNSSIFTIFKTPIADDPSITVTIHETEACPLAIYIDNITAERMTGMYCSATAHNPPHPRGYECHSTFQIINDSDSEIVEPSVLFDLRGSFVHGRVGLPTDIIVQNSDQVMTLTPGGCSWQSAGEIIRVPGTLVDPARRLVTATIPTIPPRSINHIHVYYKIDESLPPPESLEHDYVPAPDALRAEFLGAQSYFPPRRAGYPWQYPPNEEEAARYARKLDAWQVPAAMKVFPQSLPPQATIDANNKEELVARISAAQNEKAPLQIAVRAFESQAVTVSKMTDAKGNTLPAPEIACVGYTPADYLSGDDQDAAPKWYRKPPRFSPESAEWPKMRPDTLIPKNSLGWRQRNIGGTDAFWITWTIPKNAVPGVYRGTVSFTAVKDEDFSSLPSIDRKIPDMPVEITVSLKK